MRTISLLPSVRHIDRHGKTLSENDRESIRQIYDNMFSNVSLSEVYIVPASFNPDAVDAVTGEHEAPTLMFDENITAATAHETPKEAATEEEGEEYHLMREHIAYLQAHYAHLPASTTLSEKLQLPMVSGRAVITCDNTDYNRTHADADRRGLVFSVPFYDAGGALKGVISAVIRSNIVQAMLPESHYALVNLSHDYTMLSRIPGQAALSQSAVRAGVVDEKLLFSATQTLHMSDPQGEWVLWAG